MNDGPVIELGGEWDQLDDPLPPRRRRVNRLRAAVVAALVLVCLVSLGASRRPPLPPFQLLGIFAHPALGGGYNPGDLVLMDEMLVTEQDGRVVAFELDGRLRWTAPTRGPGVDGYLNTRMWRGLVLVNQYQPIPDSDPDVPMEVTGTTIAIDPRTGVEQWRLQGLAVPANDVVLMYDGDKPVDVYGSLPSGRLWTAPPGRASQLDLKTNALLTLTDAGLLTEYDLSTGAVRARGTVQVPSVDPVTDPEVPASAQYPDEMSLEVLADRIALRARRYSENGWLVAQTFTYDRATLRRVPSALDRFDGTEDCGPVLCAYYRDQMSIVDADGQDLLWDVPTGYYAYWTGSALLVTDQSGEIRRMADPRTGATLLDLQGWTSVEERRRNGLPAMTWLTEYVPLGRTFVGRLESTHVRVVGALPFPVGHCQSAGTVLACVRSDGRMAVWRINAF